MTSANAETTGTVIQVIQLEGGKYRMHYRREDGNVEATHPLDSHPGVEPGDRIRIKSDPPNPLQFTKLSE